MGANAYIGIFFIFAVMPLKKKIIITAACICFAFCMIAYTEGNYAMNIDNILSAKSYTLLSSNDGCFGHSSVKLKVDNKQQHNTATVFYTEYDSKIGYVEKSRPIVWNSEKEETLKTLLKKNISTKTETWSTSEAHYFLSSGLFHINFSDGGDFYQLFTNLIH